MLHRNFAMLVLPFSLWFGCSSATQVAPPTGEPPTGPSPNDEHGLCPSARGLTVETCRAQHPPAGYGTTLAVPVEWGVTSAGAMYFGRLLCPSGALAVAQRRQYPGLSKTPHEEWTLHCPGEVENHTWYTNPQKCGNPCPPEGFMVIPSAALRAYMASVERLQSGDLGRAQQQAELAVKLAPPNELLTSWLATMLTQTGKPEKAVELFESVIRMNPEDPHPKLYLAMAQRAAGYDGPYHAAIAELLTKLPEDHPLVAELKCLRAEKLRADGKAPEAARLTAESCKGGWDACCADK